jgi:transcriptional regulator with XRE-family HTH domain
LLRAYREQRGLTQAELADLSGMRVSDIGQYEDGTRSLTLLSMYVLARALRVPASRLIPELEKTITGKTAKRRKRKSP